MMRVYGRGTRRTADAASQCRRLTRRAPDPREITETTLAPHASAGVVVGVAAFSGSLRGLELVPSKWRPLVPPTSG